MTSTRNLWTLPRRPMARRSRRRRTRPAGLLGVLALSLAAVLVTVGGSPAGALITLTVTTNADSGPGSLRQAFLDASGAGPASGDDVRIIIPASIGNITLTTDTLAYDGGSGGTHNLTLVGNGQTITEDAFQPASVIRSQSTGTLRVENLTITSGDPDLLAGGGIFSQGPLEVDASTVTGNSSDEAGGGLYADSPITVTDSTVSDNQSYDNGGGIFGDFGVTVVGSTIADNTTADNGGGVFAGNNIVVTSSTIADNTARLGGGGLFAADDVVVTSSTVTANTARSNGVGGGGIAADNSAVLVYATVVDNEASNVANVAGGLVSFGSVIALPQGGGDNCTAAAGAVTQGWNFSDDLSCEFTDTAQGDRQGPGLDPLLGPLADNGGPTATRLPQADSPLLNWIPTASCQAGGAAGITEDQRGLTRPSGSGCDIGAVEVQVSPPPPPPPPDDPDGDGPDPGPTAPPARPVSTRAAFTG